jgi:hypothetical protein
MYISRLILMVIFSLMAGTYAYADAGPSSGADDMPGAKGTFDFKPKDYAPGETTWWKDSDGVDPGTAGCHIGTDEKGTPNGRTFGEACLPNGLLVESNPGRDALHSHSGDVGHPDTFDCNAWCIGKGKKSGVCEAVPAPPCEESAACSCV